MILHVHGESCLPRLRRWAFRHRPRAKHTLHFQPPVIVKMTRRVLLNDEPMHTFLARRLGADACSRLRSLSVIPLGGVLTQALVPRIAGRGFLIVPRPA